MTTQQARSLNYNLMEYTLKKVITESGFTLQQAAVENWCLNLGFTRGKDNFIIRCLYSLDTVLLEKDIELKIWITDDWYTWDLSSKKGIRSLSEEMIYHIESVFSRLNAD